MAGISQKVSLDEVLPLFARNVYVQGYVGWQEKGRPTEYLILLGRYVNQAKELAAFAGPNGTIRVANCHEAMPLLRILGYRLRQECGQSNAALITADAERAFLTTDSGFPLPALEDSLRQNKPFSYLYPTTKVPVLFKESAWTSTLKPNQIQNYNLIELMLRHPSLARLYWAFSRMDSETRSELATSPGLKKLIPYAPELDFYGTHLLIRSGRVEVPGGAKAEPGWSELVGTSPNNPSDFVAKLMAKDKGWLAAYFDCMARVNRSQQEHVSDAQHLKTFYTAFHGPDALSDAARPAFRLAAGLLLLLTRIQWDADGHPLVPGNAAVWKEILSQKTDSRLVKTWGKKASHWTQDDQVLEAMFAFSRLETDRSPLQMFLLFSEMDSKRPAGRKLKPETLALLARKFGQYSDQYLIFSEFPQLDDKSITDFVVTADSLEKTSNHTLRGNAMGMFQAEIGLWQILARQQQIPAAKLNESWQEVIKPFARLGNSTQLFEAGQASLSGLLRASLGRSSASQSEVIELLAGPRSSDAEAQRVHVELAKNIRAVMDGQRLVSLDTLLSLGRGLKELANGDGSSSSLIPLAGELAEFEMPRPIFTSSERTEWAAGIYNNRHTELQMQTDLTKVLKSQPTRAQLEESRGQLSSFLRDTLVGLNYAYYEPPGSQLLRVNPLFVRSHDFSGDTVAGVEDLWRTPQLFGQGTPAGGGVHLVGSLADLPYVLSEAEQDFITPENVQALIWRESVPGLLTNAILPRWWNISRTELHAIALYQKAGEELVSESAQNDQLRPKVMLILADRMVPEKASLVEEALVTGRTADALNEITPADALYLTAEFRREFPDDQQSWGSAGQELDRLCRRNPEVNWNRLSRDFGVPHRTLAQDYSRELLNMKPFPAFSGYSSRLMAESWDSNNLYWARLVDEKGYDPVVLNVLVPELTRRMVEKIFATDFEDWTALLRAMRETGEEFRQGKVAVLPAAEGRTDQLAVQ
jgi:hypothetical protein